MRGRKETHVLANNGNIFALSTRTYFVCVQKHPSSLASKGAYASNRELNTPHTYDIQFKSSDVSLHRKIGLRRSMSVLCWTMLAPPLSVLALYWNDISQCTCFFLCLQESDRKVKAHPSGCTVFNIFVPHIIFN